MRERREMMWIMDILKRQSEMPTTMRLYSFCEQICALESRTIEQYIHWDDDNLNNWLESLLKSEDLSDVRTSFVKLVQAFTQGAFKPSSAKQDMILRLLGIGDLSDLAEALRELEDALKPEALITAPDLRDSVLDTLGQAVHVPGWLPEVAVAMLRARLEGVDQPSDLAAALVAMEAALFPGGAGTGEVASVWSLHRPTWQARLTTTVNTLRSLEEDWTALSMVVRTSLELARAGGAPPRGPPVVYPKIHIRLHLLEGRTDTPTAEVRVPRCMSLDGVLTPIIGANSSGTKCLFQGREMPLGAVFADLGLPDGADIEVQTPPRGLVRIVLHYQGIDEPVAELSASESLPLGTFLGPFLDAVPGGRGCHLFQAPPPAAPASFHPECPRQAAPDPPPEASCTGFVSPSPPHGPTRLPPHWFQCVTCASMDLCMRCLEEGRTPKGHTADHPVRLLVRGIGDRVKTSSTPGQLLAGRAQPLELRLRDPPPPPRGMFGLPADGLAERRALIAARGEEGRTRLIAEYWGRPEREDVRIPVPDEMVVVSLVDGRSGDLLARLYAWKETRLGDLLPIVRPDCRPRQEAGKGISPDSRLSKLGIQRPAAPAPPPDGDGVRIDHMAYAPTLTIRIVGPPGPPVPLRVVHVRACPRAHPSMKKTPQTAMPPFCTLTVPPHATLGQVLRPMGERLGWCHYQLSCAGRPVATSHTVAMLPEGPEVTLEVAAAIADTMDQLVQVSALMR
ncbi:hypothetical protein PAPYR_4096 [Paratrimastix pyriformis]|uniref:ZZ-type domain-containing protein n=1 Tax=Paratrimastix pyriformis TaxID=342808 RepID=A0ABQ8UQT6_9EUKA|nr:hypothetical protein PAPYR_4096 [Paratrimastix pyriformis]